MDLRNRVLIGNCLDVLKTLPDSSVQCVVTSPPYWGLRDYGVPPSIWGGDPECEHDWTPQARIEHRKQSKIELLEKIHQEATHGDFCVKCDAWRGCFGLEPTPLLYVEHLVEICREVRRVLREDGVFWLNLGDCYVGMNLSDVGGNANYGRPVRATAGSQAKAAWKGLAPKQLIGIPWRAAFALQDDGWWLRSDIVWSKPNPMPDSVEDRPTRSHEYVFLLTKNKHYFYDHIAIREPQADASTERYKYLAEDGRMAKSGAYRDAFDSGDPTDQGLLNDRAHTGNPKAPTDGKRNRRTVWDIATRSYREAHFATFPRALPEVCILAGTSEKGACPTCGSPWKRAPEGWGATCKCAAHEPVPCLVLDPFSGSGTTLMVAKELRRDYLGIELNPEYGKLIEERTRKPLEQESERRVTDFAFGDWDDEP